MNKKALIYSITTLVLALAIIAGGIYWFTQGKSINPFEKTDSNSSQVNSNNDNLIQDEVASWSREVNNNFISGKWTQEEYILNNLKYIIENKGKTLPPEKGVDNIEQTFMMSDIYLNSGNNEETKNKIREYHKVIYPDSQAIINYKKNKSKKSFLQPIIVNAEIIDGVEFIDFEAAGLESVIITRPEHRIEREFIKLLKTAVIDSYTKYAELGYELRPAQVSIYLDEYRLSRGTAEASASIGSDTCVIKTWGSLYNTFRAATTDSQKNDIKQTIAHEVYHCVQKIAFPESFAAYSPFNYWYIEGSAEYFSNVVYPTFDQENELNSDFDRLSIIDEIFKIADPNYIFHQFLANNIGNDGLKEFYRTMPSVKTWAAQRESLANLPNIDTLFHNFAQSYFDGTIADTSGSLKVFNPIFPGPIRITETTQKTFRAKPFLLKRNLQEYVPNNGSFDITINSGTGLSGKYATKLSNTNEWKPMPPRIPVLASAPTMGEGSGPYCSSDSERNSLKFIQTATENSDVENIQILNITANDTAPREANSTIDRNLVGNWTVNPDSLRSIGNSLLTRIPNTSTTIDSFSHIGNVCFKANGEFFGDYVSNVSYTTNFGGASISSSMVLFGTVGGNHTTQDNNVNFTNLTNASYGRATTGFVTVPIGNKVTAPDRIAAVNQALDALFDPRNAAEAADLERAKIRLREIILSTPQYQPPRDYTTQYVVNGNSSKMKFPIPGNPDIVMTRVPH
jgi:hypothetical protein